MTRSPALLIAACGLAGLLSGFLFTPPSDEIGNNQIAHEPAKNAAPPGRSGSQNVTPSRAFARAAEFINELERATAAELPAIFARLMRLHDKGRIDLFYQQIPALIERWARLDPLGGIRHAGAISSPGLAGKILAEWTRRDPDAALGAVRDWAPESERPAHVSSVLSVLAETDPLRFRQLVEEIQPAAGHKLDSDAVASMVAAMVVHDLDSALAFVSLLPDANQQELPGTIAAALAGANPTAAIDYASTLSNLKQRDQALVAISKIVGTSNPSLADELLREFADPSQFPAFNIAYDMAQSDRESALRWLLALPLKKKASEVGRFIAREFADEDSAVALSRIGDLIEEDGIDGNELARRALYAISPDEFPTLAATFDPATDSSLAKAFANRWLEHNPEAALDWLADFTVSLPSDGDPKPYLDAIVNAVSQLDGASLALRAPALAALAAKLAPADRRTFEKLIANAAQLDHDADTFLNVLATSQESKDAFIQNRFRALTVADPEKALAAAAALTDPVLHESATKAITGRWAGYDPVAATRWAAGLPEGRLRDLAAYQFGISLADDDPGAAVSWSLSISDPKLRASSVALAVSNWSPESMSEVTEVIATLGLSPTDEATVFAAATKKLSPAR